MEQAVRTVSGGVDTDLGAEAVRRLKGRREFRAHLFAYVLVNLALWGTWGVIFATAGVWFPWRHSSPLVGNRGPRSAPGMSTVDTDNRR